MRAAANKKASPDENSAARARGIRASIDRVDWQRQLFGSEAQCDVFFQNGTLKRRPSKTEIRRMIRNAAKLAIGFDENRWLNYPQRKAEGERLMTSLKMLRNAAEALRTFDAAELSIVLVEAVRNEPTLGSELDAELKRCERGVSAVSRKVEEADHLAAKFLSRYRVGKYPAQQSARDLFMGHFVRLMGRNWRALGGPSPGTRRGKATFCQFIASALDDIGVMKLVRPAGASEGKWLDYHVRKQFPKTA